MTPAATISDACVSGVGTSSLPKCEHFTAESPGTDFVLSESHANNPSSPTVVRASMSFQAMRRAFARAAASSARCPPKGTVAAERGRWNAARSFAPELEATSLRSSASENPGRPSRNRRSCGRREGACTPTTRTPPRIAPKPSRWPARSGWSPARFGSLVGVGGGVLIVPAITAAVPIPQRVVTGTSLIAVLSTAAVSTYNFSHAGLVDPTAAAIIGGAAMLSAPFGARLTTTAGLRSTQTSPRVLSAVRRAVGAAQGGGVSPPRR